MHANLPDIAKKWEKDYASGGIARLGYQQGNWVAPFYNTNVMQGSVIPPDMGTYNYQHPRGTDIIGMDEMNTYGQLPMGTDTIGMNEMFSYPRIKPDYNFGQDIDQTYMEGDFNVSPKQPAWYNRMFNKVGEGITGLKNKFTGAYDQSQNFIRNIMNNTLIGRIAAGFDATNPKAFNYNPALQGQIDFLKGTGQYGVMDPSGLNKITSGVLAGKNLQSMFGSNDLAKMYDKSIARSEKTLANLSKQWSRLKEEDPEAYARKVAIHRARLQKKKDEQKKYFDTLKKKTTSGGGKKNYITKTDQSGKGDGGGKTYSGGAKAGTTGSWTPGGTYSGGYQQSRGSHHYSQGGLASLWPK
jgi:hypothetical protein